MIQTKTQDIIVSQVFVPGGFPKITYISREEHKLEESVRSVGENLSKLMVITGPTKSGKTVLVDKIFPQESAVWVDGGMVSDEQSFWDLIVEKLDLSTTFESSKSEGRNSEIAGDVSAEGNLLLAKGGASVSSKIGTNVSINNANGRKLSSKIVALKGLNDGLIPLIVDDFHYISKPVQKNLVRALKAPIMHGLPVIFIAIPNRKYDAVEVEREMTGRIENIEMPAWSEKELSNIAYRGFDALNIVAQKSLIKKFTATAYGSPFLMQEFCKSSCMHSGIKGKGCKAQYIDSSIDETIIFAEIAEHSGRSMFEKLKRGPRARTDRIPRRLTDGSTTDIYGVVMEALKNLKPGVESISYDSLRMNIKNLMADTSTKERGFSCS